MDLDDFNNDYLNPLLAKLSKEKKTVFLLGDYSVDLKKMRSTSQLMNFYILFPLIYVSSVNNPTNKGNFQLNNLDLCLEAKGVL